MQPMLNIGPVAMRTAIILWFLASYPKPPADYVVPIGFDRVTAEQAKAIRFLVASAVTGFAGDDLDCQRGTIVDGGEN